ncbi:MAG: stkP 1 [Gemmataceae bacterium]|nr:stkP 1 [Gemmataceae bacterium]
MATPTAAVRDFCTLLAKSKLLPAAEVESLNRKWKDEAGGADDQVEAFAKYLVGKRVLTSWQSAMVQRGRADGFFLDAYKILDQIGKGQMGGVYKAVHPLGQLVALKILPASRAKDQRVLGRFQREARLLTQLDHPNVVRAFQVGESGGRHYIVMEFLEGETLDEVLTRRKRLPVAEAVRVVRQALDGLQHLHDRRMIHRDLKPTNLMIIPAGGRGGADTTWEGTVKILDIGLGRELFDEAAAPGQVETQLTVEGAVVGTPDYMAPEQAKDARSSDVRADIYSLGCVLYRCLAGRPPFPDANIMTQMLRHATESPPPLADVMSDVPAGLQAVLDSFLAKTADARFQTPAAASEALARFQTQGPGTNPAGAEMIPAYRQWLETESQIELPKSPPPSPPAPAAHPAPPRVEGGAKRADRPVRDPVPAAPPVLPSATIKPGTGSMTPLQSPAKPGTAPAPALPAGGKGGPSYPAPGPAVPSWQPAATLPPPVLRPVANEVEVELVILPPAAAPGLPLPPEVDRRLWELDRRDVILLAVGGMGVLGAVGIGYGLARLVRGLKSTPPDGDAPEEKKE